MSIGGFQKIVWDYYRKHGRDLPWRHTSDPYKILVSEIMLQQTQVVTVIPKYKLFIRKFPNVKALARASQRDVLRLWQGLGYNRRALNLKRLAEVVMQKHGGKISRTREELEALPAVGPATAGGVLAFAFNIPTIFIETNIRRVFIHHFFNINEPRKSTNLRKIPDEAILPLVEKTLDKKNPREWYWALYDYGAMLAKHVKNPNHRAQAYKKQSTFEGSDRQLRGALLREILKHKRVNIERFAKEKKELVARVRRVLLSLKQEGFYDK